MRVMTSSDNKRINLDFVTIVLRFRSIVLLIPLRRCWRVALDRLWHVVPLWGLLSWEAWWLRRVISRLLWRIITRLPLTRVVHWWSLLPLLIRNMHLLLLPLALLVRIVELPRLLELPWHRLMNNDSLMSRWLTRSVISTALLAQVAATSTHQHVAEAIPEVIIVETHPCHSLSATKLFYYP